MFDLATRLDEDRFDVRVVGLRGGAMAAKLHKAGVAVDILGVTDKWRLGYNRQAVNRLAALLDDHQTDLVHSHLFHADVFARLAMKRSRVKHHVHTVHVAERRWRPWRFVWARWMRRRCDGIVAVSASVRDEHRRRSHLPLSDYTVIPNGIDVGRFVPDAEVRRQFRMKWAIGAGEMLAIFVGRLDRQKGVDVLLEAARLLQERRSPITILIAGAGPMQPAVEAACGERAGLYHLGFIEDIVPFLQSADMFVLPSRWEGWPLALGEAMAAGLPAIGAASPGITDVIDDGETGTLVPIGDAMSLAEAMEHLAMDAAVRQRLASAGREAIASRFTMDHFIANHESLYDRIMAGQ